jgi:hypothetical protein
VAGKISGSEMKKLFLHIPKCAGSSVLAMLIEAIPDHLEKDYDSFFRIPRPQRNQVLLNSLLSPTEIPTDKVVYGHFFPVKYIGTAKHRDFRLVTILRSNRETSIALQVLEFNCQFFRPLSLAKNENGKLDI